MTGRYAGTMSALGGKYRVGERIGGGGMADVFRAELLGAEGFSRAVADLVGVYAVEPGAVRIAAMRILVGERGGVSGGVPFLAADRAGMAAHAGVEIDHQPRAIDVRAIASQQDIADERDQSALEIIDAEVAARRDREAGVSLPDGSRHSARSEATMTSTS